MTGADSTKGIRMVFLFEQSGAVSVGCTMTTECVTIQPADMALVVDVLLVAIERAAGMEPAKAWSIEKEAAEDIALKTAPQESQIDRVLKEWRTLEDLDPKLKITSDPRYVEMAKNLLQSDPKFATTLPLGVYLFNSESNEHKRDISFDVDRMIVLAKGVEAIPKAEERAWISELRKRYSRVDANGLALALHQAGVYGSIEIQHGATL